LIRPNASPKSKSNADLAAFFKGKKFALARHGGTPDLCGRWLMVTVGLDPDKDTEIINQADMASVVPMMKNGAVDVAITQDRSGASGRLHHITYMMDSREDVLRAADILRDADVPIETGPHKHTIGQTFFLYCYEPGGNRFEIGAGGYLIFDPEWKPVVWTEAERAKGQAWGLQTVKSFHTHGTPPVPDPGTEPSS